MSQLRSGARQALDHLYADLDEADELALDNPAAVRKLIRLAKRRLKDEIEPMLQRAEQPSIEKRIKALEEWRERVESNVIPMRKAQ